MQKHKIPFYSLSSFYKSKFNSKVYKIPISVAQTCPNREGLKNMETCIFCDVWGSAAHPKLRNLSAEAQISKIAKQLKDLYKAEHFLVYFQAYTNTFAKVSQLKEMFSSAVNLKNIKGFIVGTRPDCLSHGVFDLLNTFSKDYFVAVELGVQSFDKDNLIWMKRGHDDKKSIWAIKQLKKFCPQVDISVHLMFGLPKETDTDLINTAKQLNALQVNGVKLHNLHVLDKTPLADFYRAGHFKPLSLDEYTRRVILFLEYLDPNICVHRLAALASRHEDLLAPKWCKKKMESYQFIFDKMIDQGFTQGLRL